MRYMTPIGLTTYRIFNQHGNEKQNAQSIECRKQMRTCSLVYECIPYTVYYTVYSVYCIHKNYQ